MPVRQPERCITNMTGVHNKKTRSYNMPQIKAKNTRPEMLVRKFLPANGFRFRLDGRTPPSPQVEFPNKVKGRSEARKGVRLPGKPGIVLPKHKSVIFVHACLPVGRVASVRYPVISDTHQINCQSPSF